MKIARASEKDLDAALMLLGLLDAVSGGWYPCDDEASDTEPLRFDEEDPKHLAQLWKRLRACLDASPGFAGRVIFGGCTLMAPANRIINPHSDDLELHPRLVDVASVAKALAASPAVAAQVGTSSTPDRPPADASCG